MSKNRKYKVCGIDNKGNIKYLYETIEELAGRYNLSYQEARDKLRTHELQESDNLRWYPTEWYEEEFLKEEKVRLSLLNNNSEGECGPTKEYVNQDASPFDWNRLNDPEYLSKQLKTDVYFEDRNKKLVKLTCKQDAMVNGIYNSTKTTENDNLGGKDGGKYSSNGSSEHYKKQVLEYVDKQERCYGTFLAYALCFMQIDKYRDRAGNKEGVPIEKDMVKAMWYTTCASYLREKIDLNNLLDRDKSNESSLKYSFEEKYGAGRSEYIDLPFNLAALLSSEKFLTSTEELPIKTLGQIVDEQQSK